MNGLRRDALMVVGILLMVPGCSTLNEHRDTAVGAVTGCAAGYAACLLAKGNPAACALGCVAGASLGAGIGAYLDNRRHRLAAAAQASGIPLSLSDVTTPNLVANAAVTPPPVASATSPPSPLQTPNDASRSKRPASQANGLLAELNITEMFPEASAQPRPEAREKLASLAKVYAQRSDTLGHKIETALLITGPG